jgi:hypothetical protein
MKTMQADLAHQANMNDTSGYKDVPGEFKPASDGYFVLYLGAPELKKQTLGPDYHEYPITGCDQNGDIAIARRYNLFYEFRQALVVKYQGLYIPPLPPKKVTGKGEEFTLIEREHFLRLFLTECITLKYISQSQELQTFLHCQGDIKNEL